MIENSQSGVSLQRIQRIAQHFGVPVVDLLAAPETKEDVLRGPEVIRQCLTNVPSVERGRGVVYQLVAVHSGSPLQPAFVSFAPGAGYARDKIAHQGEEVVYVLSGAVELHVEHEVITLAQGHMALFRSQSPHAFQNASRNGPAVILTVSTPPW